MSFKNRQLRLFLLSVLSLLLIRQPVNAGSVTADDYPLPPNKKHVAECEKGALQLYPGTIQEVTTHRQPDGFLIKVRIVGHHGVEALVRCDLSTGKITRVYIEE